MKKSWKYKFGEDVIVVNNSWFGGCELIINGLLQDKKTSVTVSDDLRGE
ncbi:MAG: hypothetical protein FWE21_10080 [Defluviitaleaceae bacterium]|nr:hypothetical protein [Defluviitaleaceae bacterium]